MASYRLGEMLINGVGTTANCPLGVGHLKSVSERGGDWIDDTHLLARKARQNGDMGTAFLLYLFAAERGSELAQSNAAYMVDFGEVKDLDSVYGREGVDPYEVAIVLWQRAANQGNVDARVKVEHEQK